MRTMSEHSPAIATKDLAVVLDRCCPACPSSWCTAAIATKDLSVILDGKLILDHVTFEVEQGSLIGVMGPNGAGKSTLFDAMAGLLPQVTGEVRFFGQPLREARGKLAYVPQQERVNWKVPVQVQDIVLQGRVQGFRLFRRFSEEDRRQAAQALKIADMWDRRQDMIQNLSLGQRQRVFLARALAQQADILLFDESLSGVDQSSHMQIMATLKQLKDQGKTILVVSHDLDDVVDHCDACLWVNQKVILN